VNDPKNFRRRLERIPSEVTKYELKSCDILLYMNPFKEDNNKKEERFHICLIKYLKK